MLELISVLLLAVSALRGAESNNSSSDLFGGSVQRLFDLIKADNVASFDAMLNFNFYGQAPSLRNAKGWTALHVAAYHGAEKITEYLLGESGVSLSARNYLSETPLHLACLKNHVSIVEKLIQTAKSREVNMSTVLEAEQIEKRTPIFYAINSSSVDVINILILEGVNLFHSDIYGMMPIHYAVANKNLEATNLILVKMPGNVAMQQGVCQQNFEKTISHLAAEHDFVEFAEQAFDHFNFSAIDSSGQNPACWAAINGSIRLGEHLLRNSIDILTGNCVYGKSNEITGSPLHAAAYHRRKDYVELLLRSEADEMAVDSSGGTVAHAMARQSSSTDRDANVVKEILLLLRNNKKNLLVFLLEDNRGRTPFLVAAESSSLVFAKLLHENVVIDPSSVDNDGYSALHLASSLDFLKYLLSLPKLYSNIDSRTVSVNKSDSRSRTKPGNMTVLLAAVKRKALIPVISYLIGLNADKNAANDAGQTAVHLAVEANYLEAIDMLFRFSFNFSARDDRGRTPLMYAIELERTDLAIRIVQRFPQGSVLTDKTLNIQDSPLHLAVKKASAIELVKQLIKDPAVNVSAVNANGESVLHKAVKLLLASGAAPTSLRVADVAHKRTPFHWVAIWSNSVAVEIGKIILPSLLANNAHLLQLKDYKGDTPLDLAIRHNCVEMVDFIMASSVTVDSDACVKLNSQGLTPWHFAKKLGHELMADNMVRNGFCSKPDWPSSCEDALIEANNLKSGTFEIHQVGQSPTLVFCSQMPVDCEEIHQRNANLPSGIYTIYPPDRPSVEVFCDMIYLGGGWTVFQKLVDGSQDFFLKWADYRKGFGNLRANFWLGNDNIHAITSSSQFEYSLLITLTDNNGSTGYALYDGFYIEDEANGYTLRFRSFKVNGNNIGDSLTYHKDAKFSTVDSDNDLNSSGNCASEYKGAWWYGSGCHHSNLNSVYGSTELGVGIVWQSWHGHRESMSTTAMMLRRSLFLIDKTSS